MPRTLPWTRTATHANKAATSTSSPTSGEQAAKRRKILGTNEDSNAVRSPARSLLSTKRPNRTPSTSPPPQPPAQEPMRPSDSGWIMVEDELYTVAQSFTRHLHWTEYKRLKELTARKKIDVAIIDRPVDKYSTMSTELKIKKKHEEKRQEIAYISRAITIKSGTNKDQESDDNEDMLIGDRNLAGLMFSTSKISKPSRTVLHGASIKSTNTRAAAGFAKQRPLKHKTHFSARLYDIPCVKTEELDRKEHNLEVDRTSESSKLYEDDEDDLDLDLDLSALQPSSLRSAVTMQDKRATKILSSIAPPVREKLTTELCTTSVGKLSCETSTVSFTLPNSLKANAAVRLENGKSKFDDFLPPKAISTDIFERAKARASMIKARETKTIKLDEIPTFF